MPPPLSSVLSLSPFSEGESSHRWTCYNDITDGAYSPFLWSLGVKVLHEFGCIFERVDIEIGRVVVIDHVKSMKDHCALLSVKSSIDPTRTVAWVVAENARYREGRDYRIDQVLVISGGV